MDGNCAYERRFESSEHRIPDTLSALSALHRTSEPIMCVRGFPLLEAEKDTLNDIFDSFPTAFIASQ